MKAGVALAAALALAPATARADRSEGDPRPDPRARRMAAEANLEPTRLREGLALGVSVGPSMQIGFGVPNASGNGGSLDLRIGTSASDRLAWFVDLFYTGTPSKSSDTVESGGLLAAGAQLFALDNLWLRGGVGLGSLNQSGKALAYGFGGFGGGGIDFLRRGRFAVSGELTFTTTIYGSGVVSAIALGLGATWW